MLFVLESPHVDERAAGRPVVGDAGTSALKFLQKGAWAGDSLGNFVHDRYVVGDGRLAVMNVSTVPLQGAAFDPAVKPDLTDDDWMWLGETFRGSRAWTVNQTPSAKANAAGQLLLDGLQDRLDRLGMDALCTVVACGRWVQRYARQLTGLPMKPLRVPHPSNNQWHPKKTSVPKELLRVRKLFEDYTSVSP